MQQAEFSFVQDELFFMKHVSAFGSTQVNLEVSMPKLDHAEKIYAGQWIFATGNGLISHLPMSYQGEPLGQALETSLPGQPTVLVKVMS